MTLCLTHPGESRLEHNTPSTVDHAVDGRPLVRKSPRRMPRLEPVRKGIPANGGRQIFDLDGVQRLLADLTAACRAKVQGRDDVIEMVLIAMLADGHVLLEDHPGSGKTTLAKALGTAIVRPEGDGAIQSFRRIQFTPDLLPSDVTGTTVFDSEAKRFDFHPGPVFANVVLADEINRTGPKVQAALLEAMAEKQVTVDNKTHALEPLFFVLATQNPLDLCGTYPLPAAQLDRFLFKVKMSYLERESELAVLACRAKPTSTAPRRDMTPATILAARDVIRQQVDVSSNVHECLVDIAQALRHDRRVAQAISTRCLVLAIDALKARAAMNGRDFVSPRDVKDLAIPLFSHRLQLKSQNGDTDTVVRDCVLPVLESMIRKSLK
ncbi:MAG: AAA family ATPase [Planctomycetales bacterium]|nr:AAA family ATPase [Planctomycetales bacterium]